MQKPISLISYLENCFEVNNLGGNQKKIRKFDDEEDEDSSYEEED